VSSQTTDYERVAAMSREELEAYAIMLEERIGAARAELPSLSGPGSPAEAVTNGGQGFAGPTQPATNGREVGDDSAEGGATAEIRQAITERVERYESGVPTKIVVETIVERTGNDAETVVERVDELKRSGELYEPKQGTLRVTG
jgi:hypothetical protein